MESSGRYALPFLAPGQAQKELTHNEALTRIDGLLQAAVDDRDLAAPPASPVVGRCWIVGAGATGAWAGHEHGIACWTDGGWRFLDPLAGCLVWIEDEAVFGYFDGLAWQSGLWPAAGIAVAGQQVLGAQAAAIAGPSGGATVDSQARDAIDAILGALRGHGLIAS